MLTWLKDRKIKKLEAENKALRSEIKTWRRIRHLDRWTNRVINFFTPEDYLKYLRLKAEYNLTMVGMFQEIGEDCTPKVLEAETAAVWRRMGAFKKKYEADLEASHYVLKATSES